MLLEAIERYCTEHSSGASALATELEQYTHAHCEDAHMLIGAWEGALLRMIVAMSGARRLLEIGTFTGYSALSMAEALPADGEIITCDVNAKTSAIAQRFFDRSPHGRKIVVRLGPALDTLRTLTPPFDLAFIDADKEGYVDYYEAILPKLAPDGLIAADNTLFGSDADDGEITRAITRFNEHVLSDARVEAVLLPLREGVTLIRRR